MRFYTKPQQEDGDAINLEKWLEESKRTDEHNYKQMTMVPEWYPQSGIVVAWPHANTDWDYILAEVEQCYIKMVYEIALREPVVIVVPEIEEVKGKIEKLLPQKLLNNIHYFAADTNDTWTRDTMFLTVTDGQDVRLLDFKFNGWGGKFYADDDNRVNRKMIDTGWFAGTYEDHLDFELEGGSIETNGEGDLLTTAECIMNYNRRKEKETEEEIGEKLKEWLGVDNVLWLHYGYLAGDDTDSHVDTLARLCPNNTIVYVRCDDPTDEHYEALKRMEEELQTFRNHKGEPFHLVALPMADAVYFDGERLPATYANYLVMNKAVLCPTYGQQQKDEEALKTLQKVFADKEVVGIDCNALIKQHGSLHCSTMQFPKGVLKVNNDEKKED